MFFYLPKESQELRLGKALTLLNGYWEYIFNSFGFKRYELSMLKGQHMSIYDRGKFYTRLGKTDIKFKYTKYL